MTKEETIYYITTFLAQNDYRMACVYTQSPTYILHINFSLKINVKYKLIESS